VEEIYYCICFLKKAIKMTAVIKEYYHCYQLQTKISPIILSQGYLHIYIYIREIIADNQCGFPVSDLMFIRYPTFVRYWKR
jgi:hypothetical protein